MAYIILGNSQRRLNHFVASPGSRSPIEGSSARNNFISTSFVFIARVSVVCNDPPGKKMLFQVKQELRYIMMTVRAGKSAALDRIGRMYFSFHQVEYKDFMALYVFSCFC